MGELIDTIIVCGGKGSRMKGLTKKYGCKSLIPILGIPVISYLTHSIREAVPDTKITLAIDHSELRDNFEESYNKQGITNYHFYEGLPRGPVQAFYEAG
ncbi:MAG: NTP transferase domain-containing protein, partial [archaeon]|nr:NTP transferase domain-containing protein [archaeon]